MAMNLLESEQIRRIPCLQTPVALCDYSSSIDRGLTTLRVKLLNQDLLETGSPTLGESRSMYSRA
jgi:hypothetical protein